MPEAIDPDKIPGREIVPGDIESNAAMIATIATSVRDNGSGVHLAWQGMAGVYSAPESGTLLGLMQPVSSQATAAGDNLEVVAAALSRFAAEVEPIKEALDGLRIRARAFRDEISGGVEVRELNPQWVNSQGYQGSWNAYGAYSSSTGGTGAATSEVAKYQFVSKQWHEVQEYVDRNNALIAEVNTQQVALWDAERACANKIRALSGGVALRAAASENDSLGYGIAEIPEGTEMPWGAPVERTEGCGEATFNFVVKDFLWEGIAVGGVWGTIQGLGTLVLGFNPDTGEWFSGDAYGAAWGNLGMLAAGAVIASTPPLNLLFASDDLVEDLGGEGFLPDEVSGIKDATDEVALNTGKALIAWDKWEDDPGTALGESVFNVGTALIPVGGAAVAGVKTASTAASVLSKMARVVDLVDPSSWAVNGALKLANGGFRGLGDLVTRMDTAATSFDAPTIEVYTAVDSGSALRLLDERGVDLTTVTARVDDGIPVLEFPNGRVELPAGAFDEAVGGRAADGGVDATVAAPVREPELVTAGGVRGETGPGVVNTIVDDAPVRSESGGSGDSGGSTIVREPESGVGDRTTETGAGGGSTGNDDFTGGDRVDDHGGSPAPGSDNGGARPVSPDRVYSMMDGNEHAATFAPEQLGPSRVTDDLLQNNGVTRAQFTDLINQPIDTLTAAERTVINNVRDALTAQVTPDTVFQKVMIQPHFELQPDGSFKLVFGDAERMVLDDEALISGSVSVAGDTAHLGTPRAFVQALRLDYPDTNFSVGDPSAYVVRFQSSGPPSLGANNFEPQSHSSMGGSGRFDRYDPPFTGNGFLKSDDILPEYRANDVTMRDGAEVWEVLDDGTQRLFAVLRGDEWIPQGNP